MVLDRVRHSIEQSVGLPPIFRSDETRPATKTKEYIKSLEPRRARSKKSPTLSQRLEALEARVAELERQYKELPPQP